MKESSSITTKNVYGKGRRRRRQAIQHPLLFLFILQISTRLYASSAAAESSSDTKNPRKTVFDAVRERRQKLEQKRKEATKSWNDEEWKWIDEKTFVDLHSVDVEENKDLDLGNDDPSVAARGVMQRIGASVEERLAKIFENAKTPSCRAEIGEHMGYFLSTLGKETHFPFDKVHFENECDEEKFDFSNLPQNISIGTIQNRTYRPPPDEAFYIEDPADLKLCYGILTHNNPQSTIRLIESLHEDGYVFVIHVDGKESSDATQTALLHYSQSHPYVHVLPDPYRVRVNWGGFSMVNATLQLLKYTFAIDEPTRSPLDFHKFIHLASTTYPLASNTQIRNKIASYPLDANMLNVVFKPTDPHVMSWHYFVECDDAVHRIFRLPPLRDDRHGIDLYTASQWFVISREFARYLALAAPGSFVRNFIEYAKHVVVADETFFGTVLRHTEFCKKHHNDNFLHVQFDRWENEIDDAQQRDERKCLMPNPDHCGRSPTTMTIDYIPVLELSNAMFARKFLDEVDTQVKDIIDAKRAREEEELKLLQSGQTTPESRKADTSFEGHGVLIAAKETLYDDIPLCLGLGLTKNKVRLAPCFYEGVRETLAPGWETGAVITDEVMPHNRWSVGPCSSDGSVKRMPNSTMLSSPGTHTPTGPLCVFKQLDGIRSGRCMDGESDRIQPGGIIQVFPCVSRWHQFFSFGNGSETPIGSLHLNVPRHVKETILRKGKEQASYMCVGVVGRGSKDEKVWREDENEEETEEVREEEESDDDDDDQQLGSKKIPPLSEWKDEQLVTTRCDNTDAILEWVFIPFVDEANATYEIIESENDGNKKLGEEQTEDEEL